MKIRNITIEPFMYVYSSGDTWVAPGDLNATPTTDGILSTPATFVDLVGRKPQSKDTMMLLVREGDVLHKVNTSWEHFTACSKELSTGDILDIDSYVSQLELRFLNLDDIVEFLKDAVA